MYLNTKKITGVFLCCLSSAYRNAPNHQGTFLWLIRQRLLCRRVKYRIVTRTTDLTWDMLCSFFPCSSFKCLKKTTNRPKKTHNCTLIQFNSLLITLPSVGIDHSDSLSHTITTSSR
jgi:hypothetical protein